MLVIAAYDMRPPRRLADQTGMAVVVALLVLALLSLLGITLLGLSVTESQIGSNESDLKKALFAAEAGIQEAMYRMRLDPGTSTDESDTACSTAADPVVIGKQGPATTAWADPTNAAFWTYNPPTCAWTYSKTDPPAVGDGNYFGGMAWNLDSAGRTFTSGGALVNANLTNGGSYTTTVAPVVGFVGGCWQYVDQFGIPLVDPPSCATVATNPIFKVTSTGAARDGRKVLSSMIRRFSVNPQPDGALTANTNVKVQSAAAVIDGHNHDCDGNNPSDTGSLAAATSPTGASGIDINKPQNLVCAAGTGTACKGTSSTFPSTIGALLLGPTATITQIEAFNAYLESIKVTPAQAPTSAFHGVLYVNGNYTQPPDGSTGILIVHNATDNANLGNFNGGTFKGVIIADKINKINGNAQIIGAIFGFGSTADGVNVDDITGTPNIKYSKCIIDGLSQNFPFEVVKGTWHEQ
jgi:Tfp pilus assembly protein PilX